MSLYADHRNTIKSGDLIAFRARDFWGRMIGYFTRSAHSHVAVAWRFRGRLFLLEAKEGQGVQIRAASEALPFDHITTHAFWDDHIEEDALMYLGKPYAWLDLMNVGVGLEPSADGMICSEYCAKVIRPVLEDAWQAMPKSPTPANLVEHFLDHDGVLTPVKEG